PSFAAVLGRAHRLDPNRVPAPPLVGTPNQPLPDDTTTVAALAPFVEAARTIAEYDAVAQQHAPPPGLPRRRSRLTPWLALGSTLAAAAAVILLLGLLDARSALRADAQRDGSQSMDQVEAERRIMEAETGGDELPGTTPRPRRRGGGLGSARIANTPDFVVPSEAAPLELLVEPTIIPEEPIPLETAAATVEVEPPPAATNKPAARSSDSRALRRLDQRAQRSLAAGDLSGAQKAYRALVRHGGRSTLAELAYGDLFTLAHRKGDTAGQRKLWQQYLRKFPRGRFADDARAGLCRRATSAKRVACWEHYLDDFPTGAYHRQAARALARDQGAIPGEPDE
ncbi:MAG: hypothetical protein K0V04_34295, partial [Deltaproteobacteria bacterium]|nr:hypothetical protein [Deltaproteobacteria bacterium]